jgi:hypothetical protein
MQRRTISATVLAVLCALTLGACGMQASVQRDGTPAAQCSRD